MPIPLDISTKHYFWKPYMAYFGAFELKAYQDFVQFRDGAILDLGCGDGTFAEMLKELLGFTRKLVGIDLDHSKLLRAVRRRMLYRQVLQVDASSLSFREGCFDVVFSNGVLYCVWPRVDLAIAEVGRVLRRHGLFVCTVPTSPVERHHCIAELLRMLGTTRLERLYSQRLKRRFGFVSSFPVEQWCAILEQHGLSVQKVAPYISGTISRGWSVLTLTPLRLMGCLRFIPVEQIRHVASRIQRRLMVRSYERFSMDRTGTCGDYVLVICEKV